jgi:hypothetical protein
MKPIRSPERRGMKKLPKRTAFFFDQFANNANKRILHPLDWKQFYWFIQAAYEGKTKLSTGELEELLASRGFQPVMSASLSNIYYHGRQLLKSRVSMVYKYNP